MREEVHDASSLLDPRVSGGEVKRLICRAAAGIQGYHRRGGRGAGESKFKADDRWLR